MSPCRLMILSIFAACPFAARAADSATATSVNSATGTTAGVATGTSTSSSTGTSAGTWGGGNHREGDLRKLEHDDANREADRSKLQQDTQAANQTEMKDVKAAENAWSADTAKVDSAVNKYRDDMRADGDQLKNDIASGASQSQIDADNQKLTADRDADSSAISQAQQARSANMQTERQAINNDQVAAGNTLLQDQEKLNADRMKERRDLERLNGFHDGPAPPVAGNPGQGSFTSTSTSMSTSASTNTKTATSKPPSTKGDTDFTKRYENLLHEREMQQEVRRQEQIEHYVKDEQTISEDQAKLERDRKSGNTSALAADEAKLKQDNRAAAGAWHASAPSNYASTPSHPANGGNAGAQHGTVHQAGTPVHGVINTATNTATNTAANTSAPAQPAVAPAVQTHRRRTR